MEENQSAKNIRIAKNTFFLYLIFIIIPSFHFSLKLLFNTLFPSKYRGVATHYKCKNHNEPAKHLRRSISFSSR